MKHIIISALILTVCGCQTSRQSCVTNSQTQKVTVSVTPSDGNGHKLEEIKNDSVLTLNFKVIKTDGVRQIPLVDIKQNQWARNDVAVDIVGLEQTATIQIDDEVVEINCSPGLHLLVKAIPIGDNKVRLKGAYVYSDQNEKDLTKPKEIMPFNIFAETGKTISLYELQTTFKPARGTTR